MPRSAAKHIPTSAQLVGTWATLHISNLLVTRRGGTAPLFPEYRRLFVADGLPKTERVNLPPLEVHYLDTVRESFALLGNI